MKNIPGNNRRVRLSWRQWGVVALTLLLGLGFTISGFMLARELERDRSEASFNRRTTEYQSRMKKQLIHAIQVVKALKALYASSEHVSRKEFRIFSTQLLASMSGVQALEWLPRVPHSQREAFVDSARAEGLSHFQITEQSSKGRMRKREPSSEYFPIFYVEPWTGNEPALGFDAASNPKRLQSLIKACDSNAMVASEAIKLVQERGQQTGFALFEPIYAHGAASNTITQRRQGLRGFVVGVFLVGGLVDASLAGTIPAGINFAIYDSADPQNSNPLYSHTSRIYKTHPSASLSSASREQYEQCVYSLQVADRQWRVVFQATPWFAMKNRTMLPRMVLLGGLATTLVLFLAVLGLVLRGINLDKVNRQLEEDIAKRNEAEENLARSEERYRLLAENTLDVIWTMSLELEFTYVNNAIFSMTGYTPEEWIGSRLPDHCDNKEFALMSEIIAGEFARGPEGVGVIFETTMLDKKREPIQVEIHGKVLYDQEGRPMALQGATRDIAERKKAEEARQKSEELFRASFESAPEGMALVDHERRFFMVNPRLCQMLGYAEEELLGQAFNRFTHPDDRQAGRDRWRHLFSGGASVNRGEKRFIHKNGQVVWVMISNAAIRNGQGQTQYVLSHIYDITERKMMERALRLSEQKFAKAFQHSPMWVAITTVEEGRFIDVNESFLKATGYDREEVIGRTVMDLGLRIDSAERQDIVRILRERGSVRNMEVKRRTRSGEILDMLFSAEMLPMSDEETMVAVLADITELKRAQKDKSNLEAQLLRAQKMEAIGTLAGGIAHDFNNILAAILGYAELAMESASDESKERGYFSQILVAVERAQKLVKQILAFSRKAEAEKRPVDVNRCVRQAVQLIQQTIPKMVSIELHLAQRLPYINADPGQLEQIVMNLATNAKDAMPEGGRLVFETSAVFLDEEYCKEHFEAQPGDYVRLQVSDTGQGIPKDIQEQIFDPFFTTKEVGKGTGLGLSTIYGIVKAHGGFIYCYSEVGHGTSFRIYLPVLKAEEVLAASLELTAGQEVAGGNENILLVDDEKSLREVGSSLLSNIGYSVVTAGSGEEALDIYRRQKGGIDLVILDISMPGMGGHKCLLEILKTNPDAKVLIASGYSLNGHLKDILAAGASDYISKPFQRAELLKIIRKVLDG